MKREIRRVYEAVPVEIVSKETRKGNDDTPGWFSGGWLGTDCSRLLGWIWIEDEVVEE